MEMTRHGAAGCINYLDASQASSVASQRAEVKSVPINGRFYAAARFGGINIFVSNAGVYQFHDFLALPKELYDRTVRINLDRAFYATKATAKMMVAPGRRDRLLGYRPEALRSVVPGRRISRQLRLSIEFDARAVRQRWESTGLGATQSSPGQCVPR